MSKKHFIPEQIIGILRAAELSTGIVRGASLWITAIYHQAYEPIRYFYML